MTVSPWCVRSLGILRATGGSGGAPAGWPGGVAAMVEASARVGLLLTRAVYGRHRPGLPWPHTPVAGWMIMAIWPLGGKHNGSRSSPPIAAALLRQGLVAGWDQVYSRVEPVQPGPDARTRCTSSRPVWLGLSKTTHRPVGLVVIAMGAP